MMSTMPLTIPAPAPLIQRPTVAKPKQGTLTYQDYRRLPNDGKRYEIIDGVLYMANAPSYAHQYTVSRIDRLVGGYVDLEELGVVIVAPFEVHLPNIATPIQPDVVFIRAENQPDPTAKLFTGAPDLVVEVISPSSARRDRVIKFSAYERAGVREYWLVDPRFHFVEVYALQDSTEFELVGQFGSDEMLTSTVLRDLSIPVARLFVAAA